MIWHRERVYVARIGDFSCHVVDYEGRCAAASGVLSRFLNDSFERLAEYVYEKRGSLTEVR